MKKKEVLFLLLAVTLLFLPMFVVTYNLYPRLDTDYDSNMPIFSFIIDYIKMHHSFPLVIPYVGNGMSIVGDLASGFLNPILFIPLFLFGIGMGIKVTYFLVFFFSAITMWLFLTMILKKNQDPPKTTVDKMTVVITLWGSLLYAFSGALVARIAAGHFEKVLTYPLVPLFCLLAFKKRISFIESAALGSILALCFFSADLYGSWFLIIYLCTIRGYYFFSERHERKSSVISLIFIFFTFFVLSLIKLIPFFYYVGANAVRYASIKPFAGSIQSFLLPVMYIMPFQVNFYDRPFFQRTLGLYYNWYEYYSFISIFPFFFLISIKHIVSDTKVKILLLLLLVSALYLGLQYPYSPFYWLFTYVHFFQSIRVPQRIMMYTVTVAIGLLAYCAQAFIKTSKSKWKYQLCVGIFVSSFLWVYLICFFTFKRTFVPINHADMQLVHTLRQADTSKFYVVNFAAPKTFLINDKLYDYNYYYSWRNKDVPNFLTKDEKNIDYSLLQKIRPKYVITAPIVNVAQYNYFPFLQNKDMIIWKTNEVTIRPTS